MSIAVINSDTATAVVALACSDGAIRSVVRPRRRHHEDLKEKQEFVCVVVFVMIWVRFRFKNSKIRTISF